MVVTMPDRKQSSCPPPHRREWPRDLLTPILPSPAQPQGRCDPVMTAETARVSLLRLPPGHPLEARPACHCLVAVSGATSVPPPSALLGEREGCFWMPERGVSFPETSRIPLLRSFIG